MSQRIQIYQGDCFDYMPKIPSKSIDLILCDLPYGTIACKWDTVLPFDKLWNEYNRVIKKHGAIVLFGTEPFTSKLICSNLQGFKYRWDWNKKIPSGMSYAKYRPMQQTEDIAVFTSKGEKTTYYPQMVKRGSPIKGGGMGQSESAMTVGYKPLKKIYEYKNPTTLIEYSKIRKGAVHPTQKPVPLLEYLIETYTQENDIVLDNCMGSGSTGVACINTNRRFIGIEISEEYFEIAKQRIKAQIERAF